MTSPLIPRRRVLQGIALGGGLMMVGGACAPTSRLSPDLRPDPTKPEGTDLLPQVEHIVIYMQENHSYDSYFGMLKRPGADGYTFDALGNPTNSNPLAGGGTVTVHHATDTTVSAHSGQNWSATIREVNGGAMDGFGLQSPDSLQYFTGDDIPFYYGLANQFVLCDRWFASTPCQTHPNRRYLQAGTSAGLIQTDVQKVLAKPEAPNGTIWDRLNDHGISWQDYCWDLPDIALFPRVWLSNQSKVKPTQQFLWDCASGSLPAVSIVSPGTQAFSEEPTADVQVGEAYSAMLINALMQSPAWDKTVMFFTYDEHGGFYDHVTPPPTVAPDDIAPDLEPGDLPGGFDRYGIRVPSIVISPFAKKDYVSHVVHDHTSILKFIETKWNLGALTRRDAAASDLLDTLDFDAKAFLDPPVLPAPALPDGVSLLTPGTPALPGPTGGPLHV